MIKPPTYQPPLCSAIERWANPSVLLTAPHLPRQRLAAQRRAARIARAQRSAHASTRIACACSHLMLAHDVANGGPPAARSTASLFPVLLCSAARLTMCAGPPKRRAEIDFWSSTRSLTWSTVAEHGAARAWAPGWSAQSEFADQICRISERAVRRVGRLLAPPSVSRRAAKRLSRAWHVVVVATRKCESKTSNVGFLGVLGRDAGTPLGADGRLCQTRPKRQ